MLRIELASSADWGSEENWQKLASEAVAVALDASPFAELQNKRFALEVSIKLTDSTEVQRLNADYRDKDKPTNILSFPLVPRDLLETLSNSDDGEVLLGDLVLSHEVCEAEATEKQISLIDHYRHLIVHGTFHLLGYDHMDEVEATIMEDLETKALKRLGVANPYAD